MSLLARITKAVEKQAAKYELMETEPIRVTFFLTNEEVNEFKDKVELNEHYTWQLNGNELTVNYME